MFFQKNRNLFIGVALVAIAWLILYYTIVAPQWQEAQDNRKLADGRRVDWQNFMKNSKAENDAKKSTDANKIEYLTRAEADKKMATNRARIDEKFSELKQIEFGNHESLKAFTVFAAGKGGDTKNLLNEKIRMSSTRANGILKAPILAEKLIHDFENADDANNLLRIAMYEAFLTAAREAGVEQVVQIVNFSPSPIEVPEETKSAGDEPLPDEPKKTTKPKSKKDKDKEKEEEKPKVDRLIQFPMKVLLRIPEKKSAQILFELEKPTPDKQKTDELRGYFSIRGFHIAQRENVQYVEMTVQLSALLRESEAKLMHITWKEKNASGGNNRRDDDDPFK